MQLSVFLLAAAAAAAAASEANPANAWTFYCDHGTEGNGECERFRYNTYCCSTRQGGQFQIPRDVLFMSRNGHGDKTCGDGGYVYCA
ncbi:hypothetical protein E4U41_001897 [Claviceps citrina]|nr:hypothetical protein E4U41_001897 [Claviceps citrina]